MKNKLRKKEPILLPLYFKKIGITVMILALVSAVTVKLLNVQLGQSQKELFRLFMLNSIILGLVFLAWSRDKLEDEMTRSIRLISMSWTLLWAVLLVVIKPLIDLIFQDPVNQFTGQEFVIIMLIYYLFVYYQQKRNS